MSTLFEITDKTGRDIRLTQKQFKHIVCHKGMENYLTEIKQTLQNPVKIIPHEIGDVYDYYQYYKERRQKAKYLQVIVKYLNGHGFIVTAYFVRHIQT